tara:strand:- start:352 stop:1110 length:759 start_codon:yes stop_codon:yes gene_type:complete
MNIVQNLYNSRNVLKKVLDIRGYNSNTEIKDYTIDELDRDYDSSSANGTVSDKFSFSVTHKEIPEQKTHVLYYNIPKKGDSRAPRVTRSIINTINSLYEEEDNNIEDNCLIVINEAQSETIMKLIIKLNIEHRENIINDDTGENNPTIQEFIQNSNNKYNYKYLGNVHVIWLKILALDPLSHSMVPEHRIIKDSEEIKEILIKCNCNKNQLPMIYSYSDTIAKLLCATPGDLCEIKRINKHSGIAITYRLCK